jgi:hypothetical protein
MRAAVKAPAPPSFAMCLVLLALVDVSLRAFGLRRTAHWLQRSGRSQERSLPPGAMPGAVRAVTTAASFYPRRALCLEQSLVLYWVLRRWGAAVELRVGVQPFPFAAHAWVEHKGKPINEHEEFVMRLAPFPSFGA